MRVSQTRRLQSAEQVASSAASGESASFATSALWPSSTCMKHVVQSLGKKGRCAAGAAALAPHHVPTQSSPLTTRGQSPRTSRRVLSKSINCTRTLVVSEASIHAQQYLSAQHPTKTKPGTVISGAQTDARHHLQRLPGGHVPQLHGARLGRNCRERSVRRQHAARGLRLQTGLPHRQRQAMRALQCLASNPMCIHLQSHHYPPDTCLPPRCAAALANALSISTPPAMRWDWVSPSAPSSMFYCHIAIHTLQREYA